MPHFVSFEHFSGQGVFRWTNGCIYEGEVANGLRCGHGTLRHEPSGVSYVGNWLNGKKHGQVHDLKYKDLLFITVLQGFVIVATVHSVNL